MHDILILWSLNLKKPPENLRRYKYLIIEGH